MQFNEILDVKCIEDGEYSINVDGHNFAMRLITKNSKVGDELRILMVVSSSKWYNKTNRRWSGFAFYNGGEIQVWDKFRGNKKRGRHWDALAKAFKDQIINGNQNV